MSFSKAKIVRFNDINVGTPVSTNPIKERTSDKTKKTKTGCKENVSPALSESDSIKDGKGKNFDKENTKKNCKENPSPATSENGSVKSVTGAFKTPILPKKTKTVSSATKIKPKELSRELFSNDLEALNEKNEECEKKTKYILKLTEELDTCKKDLINVKAENEQIQREHQNEMQELEFEMLKTMTQLQKQEEEAAIQMKVIEEKLQNEIIKLKKAHEYQIGQVILDYEIKLKDWKEGSENELQNRLEELEKTWKQKLKDTEAESDAIIKECQAIGEYNIIQCELEKKEVQKSLDEAILNYKNLLKKYDQLLSNQEQVDKNCANTEQKLKNQIKKLHEKIKEKEREVKSLNADIKAYQITLSNSQMTIEVLKKRLIDSDKDVEQLKHEMSRCDEKLLEYENKYFQLNEQLKEAKDYNEELELQYEASIKLNEKSIKQITEQLLDRVGNYEEQVKGYKNKEDQYLKEQIFEQSKIIQQINLQIKEFEETVDKYVDKEKLWMNKMNCLNDENEKNQELIKQKDAKIKEYEEKFKNLQEKNEDLNTKYTHYKTRLEEMEIEAKENSQTIRKYIQISGKYDALLQDTEMMSKKMEGLLIIEKQYEKLKKEKEILESENLSFKNKFDEQKLKKYKFAAKDKENLGSPNRSIIESPNRGSPFRGSPFRERN